jgi:hypothetical protein
VERGETLTAVACERAIRETYAALMSPRPSRRRRNFGTSATV